MTPWRQALKRTLVVATCASLVLVGCKRRSVSTPTEMDGGAVLTAPTPAASAGTQSKPVTFKVAGPGVVAIDDTGLALRLPAGTTFEAEVVPNFWVVYGSGRDRVAKISRGFGSPNSA